MQGGFVRMIDQVEDGAVHRIRGGAEDAGRLVEHQVETPGSGLHDRAIADNLFKTRNRAPMIGRDRSSDRDPSLEEEGPGSAGADAEAFSDEVFKFQSGVTFTPWSGASKEIASDPAITSQRVIAR
jgi:hypothetical protein